MEYNLQSPTSLILSFSVVVGKWEKKNQRFNNLYELHGLYPVLFINGRK